MTTKKQHHDAALQDTVDETAALARDAQKTTEIIMPDADDGAWHVDPDAVLTLPDRPPDPWAGSRSKPAVLPRHDDGESEIMHAAFEHIAGRNYFRLALCLALYFVLAILWAPGWQAGNQVYSVDRTTEVIKRKVLRPPPERVFERVVTKDKKARRVPMPDTTPDEPEPLVEPDPPPEIEMVATDDWEIGIPDAPPEPALTSREAVARVGEIGVEPPIITRRILPNYPAKAVKVRMTGYVILEAVLHRDGSITDIKVLRELGKGKFGFEEAAIEALKQWEFLPGKVQGRPADVMMTLKIDFLISNGGVGP